VEVAPVTARPARRIAALALAAALALGLAGCGGGRGIRVDAIFADVGDLPRFANVQVADVVVGSARSVRLDGRRARVTMRIDPAARVPRNAVALIRSTSLLGELFVELRPPEGEPPAAEPLRDGDVIPIERTARVPGLDDALARLARLLEGGTAGDLAAALHAAAAIVRGREQALGEIFDRLRRLTGVAAARAPDLARAVGELDRAFASFAAGRDTIARALASTAEAAGILAGQRAALDRLLGSLDRAVAVLARYATTTREASDRALRDLRLVLDEAMRTTADLERAFGALASFTDLWPRAIPGDYIQLDIVLTLANRGPSGAGAGSVGASAASVEAAGSGEAARPGDLAALLWRALR
jgi:phospholipid/cholesterol/gamma-HCH transport system substrate-binding protein